MAEQGSGMPLSLLGSGGAGRVLALRGREETCRYLENLGFVPGTDVSVISEIGGNVIVGVKGTRVAISRSMANKIFVQ